MKMTPAWTLIIAIMLQTPQRIVSYYYRTQLAENISRTLDNLLQQYDKNLRPGFGGNPTLVKIDLNIRSMGPISEQSMIYAFDCYFRQTWHDKRLRFQGSEELKLLQLNEKMLRMIWKPDTYIINGKGSYLHNLTSPNVLFRITQKGEILYSMRLTIKASCPMHLQKFPMDRQRCPLIVGSHGYASEDLLYEWKRGAGHSIEIAKDMTLSQFDLRDFVEAKSAMKIGNRGNFSILLVNFEFERHMGYFLIQLYVPCSLLVILSWVGFWINREATGDRIALGITTVLTMTFLGMDNRQDLPRVSYSTALDWFVAMCFAFILATIIEFAGVHYFTKHGSGELHLMLESDEEEEEEAESLQNLNFVSHGRIFQNGVLGGFRVAKKKKRKKRRIARMFCIRSHSCNHDDNDSASMDSDELVDNCCYRFVNCIKGSTKYKDLKLRGSTRKINSVSQIDKLSRVCFPLTFLTLNFVYWIFYLKF